MKEEAVSLGIRLLREEFIDPQMPRLEQLGWRVEVEEIDGKFVVKIHNPMRGTIYQVCARMVNTSGKVIAWEQPVFVENPGVGIAPVRRIRAPKGQGEDRYFVYLLITERPIVFPRLNSREGGIINVAGMSIKHGIASVEFPRGIGEGRVKEFELAALHREQRIRLIGRAEQEAFEKAGGFAELHEEMPQVSLCFGMSPMLIGGLNPNTAYFGTTQGCWLIPVAPQKSDDSEGKVVVATSPDECIKGVVALRFPEETDLLLDQTEKILRQGAWNNQTPILVDSFTKSILADLPRLIRQNRIPVTG